MKKILIINGSASGNSSNQQLIHYFIESSREFFHCTQAVALKTLPSFDPELSVGDTPVAVLQLRESIAVADGIFICTPEYVFSIPSGLKNMIEWCVSTTVFSDKPLGIVTASAIGEKGHEELQLIMKTVMANFNVDTCLLIQGIKGKINAPGNITDETTEKNMIAFMDAFRQLVEK